MIILNRTLPFHRFVISRFHLQCHYGLKTVVARATLRSDVNVSPMGDAITEDRRRPASCVGDPLAPICTTWRRICSKCMLIRTLRCFQISVECWPHTAKPAALSFPQPTSYPDSLTLPKSTDSHSLVAQPLETSLSWTIPSLSPSQPTFNADIEAKELLQGFRLRFLNARKQWLP